MKKNKPIGLNYIDGCYISAYSSYNGIFKDEVVLIDSGWADSISCIIGNIDDVYPLLLNTISDKRPQSFEDLCGCVFLVIQKYFGDYSNADEREKNYLKYELSKTEKIGKVSDLKGKNAALCVERAMLAQNLLKYLNIDSYYKCSAILNNDKLEGHAYNLINCDGRYYIFDSTMPTLIQGEINPLVAEIPKNVFDLITSPNSRVGYSVEVSYYNPLKSENKHIVYDYDRENIYVVDEVTKKI